MSVGKSIVLKTKGWELTYVQEKKTYCFKTTKTQWLSEDGRAVLSVIYMCAPGLKISTDIRFTKPSKVF